MKNNNNHFLFLFFIFIISFSSSSENKSSFLKSKSKLKSKINNKSIEQIDDIYDISGQVVTYYALGKCTQNNCEKCIASNKCQCPNGYAQDPRKVVTDNEKSCQYKRKIQWIYFLLEFIFPFGIGHFYANRILNGLIKMLSLFIIITLDCVMKNVLNNFKAKTNFNIFIIITYIFYTIGHIFDIIMIGINKYEDGNNIMLTTLHY